MWIRKTSQPLGKKETQAQQRWLLRRARFLRRYSCQVEKALTMLDEGVSLSAVETDELGEKLFEQWYAGGKHSNRYRHVFPPALMLESGKMAYPQISDKTLHLIALRLQDKKSSTRDDAFSVLGKLAPIIVEKRPEFINLLIELLNSENSQLSSASASICIQLDETIFENRPELIDAFFILLERNDRYLLIDIDYNISRLARIIIKKRHEFVDFLFGILKEDRLLHPHQVIAALSHLGSIAIERGPEFLDFLAGLFKSENPKLRSAAVSIFASLDPSVLEKRPESAEALFDLLRDEDPEIRSSVISAIGKLGTNSHQKLSAKPNVFTEILDSILAGLLDIWSSEKQDEETTPVIILYYLEALGSIAVQIKQDLLDAVIEILNNKEGKIRYYAINYLIKVIKDDSKNEFALFIRLIGNGLLDILDRLLEDEVPHIRSLTIDLLDHLHPLITETQSEIIDTYQNFWYKELQDTSRRTQARALSSIFHSYYFTTAQKKSILHQVLKNNKYKTINTYSKAAFHAMGINSMKIFLGFFNEIDFRMTRKKLQREDSAFRSEVVHALGTIASAETDNLWKNLNTLIELLNDGDERVRSQAIKAIGNLGPVATQHRPDVLDALVPLIVHSSTRSDAISAMESFMALTKTNYHEDTLRFFFTQRHSADLLYPLAKKHLRSPLLIHLMRCGGRLEAVPLYELSAWRPAGWTGKDEAPPP